MGPLVADASALIGFIAAGRDATPFDPYLEPTAELHVPEVCDVEVVSAIRRSLRRGAIGVDQARVILVTYAEMPLRRHRHFPLLARMFDLRDNFAASDASYVALAEMLGARLVTADAHLARAVADHTEVVCVP